MNITRAMAEDTAAEHLKSLDSLRALAALAVFYLHLEALAGIFQGQPVLHALAPLGMFGVDLFYVLSGYLICGAILRPQHWRPARFALQRFRRIAPAYYVSILLVLLGSYYAQGGWPAVFAENLRGDLVRHLGFIHNLSAVSHGSINGVYWTLGVEIGFYLLAMLCAPWLRQARRCAWVLLAWACVAFAWRAAVFWLGPAEPWWRFFYATQLPGALDAFAIGASLALLGRYSAARLAFLRSAGRGWVWLVAIGVLCIAFAYVLPLKERYWAEFFSAVIWRFLLALGFGGLLALFLTMPERNSKWLGRTGLPWLGQVSYSIYLYHVPVIFAVLWAAQRNPVLAQRPLMLIVIVAVVMLAAALSYSLVEAPMLARSVDMPESRAGRRNVLLVSLLCALLVGGALRLNGLERESMWSDELFSVGVAAHVGQAPDAPIVHKHLVDLEIRDHFLTWKQADTAPPLYEYLLKAWIKAWGDSDFAIRALSVVFGLLVLVAACVLPSNLPRHSAVFFVALCATCHAFIEYSQEARSYALVILLATLTLALFLRDLERSQRLDDPLQPSPVQLLAMSLLMLSHYYGLLYCGLFALAYGVAALRQQRWRDLGWMVTPFLPLVIYLPWGLNGILIKLASPVHQHLGLAASVFRAFRDAARLVTPGFGAWIWPLLLIALAFSGLQLRSRWRTVSLHAEQRPAYVAWLSFILIPLLVALALATRNAEFYNPRYLVIALPALLLLVAILLAELRGRYRVLAGVVVGCIVVISLAMWLARPSVSKEQYREAAEYISRSFSSGDRVVGMWRPNRVLYAHYLARFVGQDYEQYLDGISAAEQVDTVAAGVAQGHRVFLFDHVDLRGMTDASRSRLGLLGFHELEHREFHKISVWVLQR